jgi:ATP-dependent Clp protease adaptor protein ClpS
VYLSRHENVRELGSGQVTFIRRTVRKHDNLFLHISMSNKKYELDRGEAAVIEHRPRIKEPPHFAVILHNDDYTTMEFVISVLKKFFQKKEDEAVQIMLQVHQKGKGIAGIYSYEIAETKVMQVHEYAKSKGYPLMCSTEPAT